MAKVQPGGKRKSGNKKHGRMRKWCERYRVLGTREKNRKRILRRHLKKHPHDDVALHALKAL
jgi:hypothetical protein